VAGVVTGGLSPLSGWGKNGIIDVVVFCGCFSAFRNGFRGGIEPIKRIWKAKRTGAKAKVHFEGAKL